MMSAFSKTDLNAPPDSNTPDIIKPGTTNSLDKKEIR